MAVRSENGVNVILNWTNTTTKIKSVNVRSLEKRFKRNLKLTREDDDALPPLLSPYMPDGDSDDG